MSLVASFAFEIETHIKPFISISELPKEIGSFFSEKPLKINFFSYIDHILYQLALHDETLPIAYILLESAFPYLSLNTLHKFVFTSISLSYKFSTDLPRNNSELEKIGIIKAGELQRLEQAFLQLVDWNFQITRFDQIKEFLALNSKTREILEANINEKEENCEIEDYSNQNNHEIDDESTGYGSNNSFSELSAFF